jgi:hypothetical protein
MAGGCPIFPSLPTAGGVDGKDFVGRRRNLAPAAADKTPASFGHDPILEEFREDRTALSCRHEYKSPAWIKRPALPVRPAINAGSRTTPSRRYRGDIRQDRPNRQGNPFSPRYTVG